MGVQKGRNATTDKKKQCLVYRKRVNRAVSGRPVIRGRSRTCKSFGIKKYFSDYAPISEVYDHSWQTELAALIELGTNFVTPLDN